MVVDTIFLKIPIFIYKLNFYNCHQMLPIVFLEVVGTLYLFLRKRLAKYQNMDGHLLIVSSSKAVSVP